LQGLNTFSQNYAGNAYQNAFTNYQNQRNNIFGNLTPISKMGLDATNKLADVTTGYGGSMANLNTSLGSTLAGNYGQQGYAQGAGTAGAANTLGGTYAGIGTPLGQLAGNYFAQPNSTDQANQTMSNVNMGVLPAVSSSYRSLPGLDTSLTQDSGE